MTLVELQKLLLSAGYQTSFADHKHSALLVGLTESRYVQGLVGLSQYHGTGSVTPH
jgi:hypothetical protein